MKAVTPATMRIVDFFIWWAVRDLNPRPPARHAGTRLARQACQLSDLPIGPSFRVSRHKGKCKSVTPFFQLATQMATRKDRQDEKAEYYAQKQIPLTVSISLTCSRWSSTTLDVRDNQEPKIQPVSSTCPSDCVPRDDKARG